MAYKIAYTHAALSDLWTHRFRREAGHSAGSQRDLLSGQKVEIRLGGDCRYATLL